MTDGHKIQKHILRRRRYPVSIIPRPSGRRCWPAWANSAFRSDLRDLHRSLPPPQPRPVWQAFERGETDQATLRVERFRRLAAELGIPDLPLERISAFYLRSPGRPTAALSRGAGPGAGRWPENTPWPSSPTASPRSRTGASPPRPSPAISSPWSYPRKWASPSPIRAFSRPALQKIGVEAADVLYVGDSVTSDMAAARNAGMDFCWLNPGKAEGPGRLRPGLHYRRHPRASLPVVLNLRIFKRIMDLRRAPR